MTVNHVRIPCEAFKGPGVVCADPITEIQSVRGGGSAVNITANYSCPSNTPRLKDISFVLSAIGAAITRVSVSLGEFKLLETTIRKGYDDFSIEGPPDAKAPASADFNDLRIVFLVNFAGPECYLYIEQLSLNFTD